MTYKRGDYEGCGVGTSCAPESPQSHGMTEELLTSRQINTSYNNNLGHSCIIISQKLNIDKKEGKFFVANTAIKHKIFMIYSLGLGAMSLYVNPTL